MAVTATGNGDSCVPPPGVEVAPMPGEGAASAVVVSWSGVLKTVSPSSAGVGVASGFGGSNASATGVGVTAPPTPAEVGVAELTPPAKSVAPPAGVGAAFAPAIAPEAGCPVTRLVPPVTWLRSSASTRAWSIRPWSAKAAAMMLEFSGVNCGPPAQTVLWISPDASSSTNAVSPGSTPP